jgi:hypothetical protein
MSAIDVTRITLVTPPLPSFSIAAAAAAPTLRHPMVITTSVAEPTRIPSRTEEAYALLYVSTIGTVTAYIHSYAER